jgi:hypothetical protein
MKTATIDFMVGSELDADLFEAALIDAANATRPAYIGDIVYDSSSKLEQWIAEGNMRSTVNVKTGRAVKNQDDIQAIPDIAFTVDQIGRLCEGPVELMLGLDVQAVVLDGTDKRPDKTIAGIKFDIKGATVRPATRSPSHKTA